MTLREWIDTDGAEISYVKVHSMSIKLGLKLDVADYYPQSGESRIQVDQKCSAVMTQFQIEFGLDEEF